MKIFKTLSVSLLLAGALVSTSVSGKVNSAIYNPGTPVKTVCIKHPAAANVTAYFSEASLIHFEIYKVGSAADIQKVIDTFLKDKDVESCQAGPLTGDYQAFDISLKKNKNKAWFATMWKKAGSNNIKINNNEIIEIERL